MLGGFLWDGVSLSRSSRVIREAFHSFLVLTLDFTTRQPVSKWWTMEAQLVRPDMPSLQQLTQEDSELPSRKKMGISVSQKGLDSHVRICMRAHPTSAYTDLCKYSGEINFVRVSSIGPLLLTNKNNVHL